MKGFYLSRCDIQDKAVIRKSLPVALPVGLSLMIWLGFPGDWRPTARLISYDKLPADEDEACARPEAGAGLSLMAGMAGELPLRNLLMQVRTAGGAWNPEDASQRKPERTIRDPYAAYSAVAVDTNHDEVVMTDENLFNIWVYDRGVKTSPNKSSEPKRLIGGLNTKIEFQCGLYIDPANGDIYAVNNDTIDTLVIFSRKAIGDVKPDRELHTPHGTFGITVDEEKQELFLTVQHDNAIVVYNKSAKGSEAPLRVVQGDHTGLADPHGMVLDTKRGLLFVTNHGSSHSVRQNQSGNRKREGLPGFPLNRDDAVPGSGKIGPPSITVYAKDAKGDARPLRTIQGPRTQRAFRRQRRWKLGSGVRCQRVRRCGPVTCDQRTSEPGQQPDRPLPRQEEQRIMGGELRQSHLRGVQTGCHWRRDAAARGPQRTARSTRAGIGESASHCV
jgi:hypothetical protein